LVLILDTDAQIVIPFPQDDARHRSVERKEKPSPLKPPFGSFK
jgi:hypothetical protein